MPGASRRGVLALACVLALSATGCSKASLGDLRKKNQTTIDTAVAAYDAMTRTMASTTPVVDGACSKPGLVPVVPISFSTVNPRDRFGPIGDGDTEIVDASYVTAKPGSAFPPLNGIFKVEGPVDNVVNHVRWSKTSADFKVDKKRTQAEFDAASKVRHIIVARFRPVPTSAGVDYADVFLFEYPKANLVCSFALDATSDKKFVSDNQYDPKTGQPTKDAYDSAGNGDALRGLFASALRERFGITFPESAKVSARLADDPKVRARAEAVSTAYEAAGDKLPECTAAEASGGIRIGKKALRILIAKDLLPRRDPNVEVDPASSEAVMTYLRTRETPAAATLASTETWRVLDITSGGTAASIDGRSFVGGGASGRQVTIDGQNRPKCQKRFRLAPPEKMDAKVRTGGSFPTSNIGEMSAIDLRKRIDAELGPP